VESLFNLSSSFFCPSFQIVKFHPPPPRFVFDSQNHWRSRLRVYGVCFYFPSFSPLPRNLNLSPHTRPFRPVFHSFAHATPIFTLLPSFPLFSPEFPRVPQQKPPFYSKCQSVVCLYLVPCDHSNAHAVRIVAFLAIYLSLRPPDPFLV